MVDHVPPGMSYPSFEEYTDALRLPPSAVFPDPVLAGGNVRKGAAGVPFARSGNFALTYEVSSNGSRYAVRCFHKESDALEKRYDAIARKLKVASSPFFVEFDFQPAGIRTESGQFPIVKMAWADGVSLAEFVSAHRDDREALLTLRETLRTLARHLQQHDIAHGDIQPGNIVVKSPTELKLIDYDGMYVPELEPWGSTELGQRNFQHPGRSWLHYDERLDRFSFALLEVALEALATQPALWELTGSDEAGIVLRAADYADPGTSTAFGVLAELDGLGVRAQQLAAICRSPFERVPSLEDFLAGRRIPAAAPIKHATGGAAAKPAYLPAYAVVDATNFARCCAHIGDRVELVGRVRRVIREPAEDGVAAVMRIEFGDAPEDLVRLLILTDGDGGGLSVLAGMPAGQWLSAIGLVDPILTETNGKRPYKSVSLTITEQSQLRLITEAEAQHRLAADPAASRPGEDVSVTIGTDPALPGTSERPPPQLIRILSPAPVAQLPSSPPLSSPELSPLPPPAPTAASAAVAPQVEPCIEHVVAPAVETARTLTAVAPANAPVPKVRAKAAPAATRRLALPPELLSWIKARARRLDAKLRELRLEERLAAAATNARAWLGRAKGPDGWLQRAGRVHPAWWLVAVLTVLLVAQRWSLTRSPEAVTPIAATDVEEVRPQAPAATPPATAQPDRKPSEPSPRRAAAPSATAPRAAAVSPAKTAATPPAKATAAPTTAPAPSRARLLAFEDLRSARRPITTIAGPIDIATSSGPPRTSVVTVSGAPVEGTRAESNVLAHRSVYSDREVIVGFSSCTATALACQRSEPFWLLLRRSAQPVLKRSPGLRANKAAGSVNVASSGVHVDLGLWDGVRQVATLTSLDDIYVTRIEEAPAPLTRADCRAVTAALESCAASRECGSYEAIVRGLPAARMVAVQRLFHETTGLNSAMFRTVCVRSCELGLTPTSTLVKREVCGGATRGQWAEPGLVP